MKDAKRMFCHQGSGKGAKNRRDVLSQNIQFGLSKPLINGHGGNDLALVQVLGHFLSHPPYNSTKYDVTKLFTVRPFEHPPCTIGTCCILNQCHHEEEAENTPSFGSEKRR